MLLRPLLLCLILSFSCALQAQNVVKYGNDFLSIGVGARAHGMGKAVVAHTTGGNAGYWNPAGIVNSPSAFQFNVMHAEWIAGVAKYDYASLVNVIGKEKRAAIGLTIIRLGIDNIPYTFELVRPDGTINTNLVTGFSYADYAILTSYSKKSRLEGLRYGGNAKIIYRSAGRFGTAWGFGLDLGAQYDYRNWTFGATLRDITSTFNAWSYDYKPQDIAILQATGNEVPVSSVEIVLPRITLGAAYRSQLTETIGFLGEADFEFTTDGQRNVLVSSELFNMDAAAGVEFNYKRKVFLRAGVNNFQQVNDEELKSALRFQPNFGLGVNLGAIQIDYALNNVGSAGSSEAFYSHIFSLTLNIKTKRSNGRMPKSKRGNKKPKVGFPDYIEQID